MDPKDYPNYIPELKKLINDIIKKIKIDLQNF